MEGVAIVIQNIVQIVKVAQLVIQMKNMNVLIVNIDGSLKIESI